ncbi:hypothetical protein BD626DRAFT_507020 [Schizophyllum amplum]|uniref:Uncharacterized protein n=1 Tax=Schizophyllum amplum TaxID=97359 RepID=A0A550C4P8_9AGAR|nr:hypothetical protein BD626DRAFT_507020 [Auriculariopsis ampla]
MTCSRGSQPAASTCRRSPSTRCRPPSTRHRPHSTRRWSPSTRLWCPSTRHRSTNRSIWIPYPSPASRRAISSPASPPSRTEHPRLGEYEDQSDDATVRRCDGARPHRRCEASPKQTTRDQADGARPVRPVRGQSESDDARAVRIRRCEASLTMHDKLDEVKPGRRSTIHDHNDTKRPAGLYKTSSTPPVHRQ